MFTIKFKNCFLKKWFTLAGPDEEIGNIRNVDLYIKDLYYGEKTFEKALEKMEKTVLNNLVINENISLIIGGELSNQLASLNNTLKHYQYPYLGVYSACSSFVESIIIAGSLLSNGIDDIGVITSSHTHVSERQFRFPIEYGNLKPSYSTTTMTSSIAAIISKRVSNYKITNATIGRVIDYGIKDSANMGAVMAPAAANTIYHHLKNTNTNITDYDLILTGDLGIYGEKILYELLMNEYKINPYNILDAGSIVYKEKQNKGAGASGPTVIPFVLFNKILQEKNYKRILVVATGSLHSPTLVNQKNTIPAIAHAIEIEVQNVN